MQTKKELLTIYREILTSSYPRTRPNIVLPLIWFESLDEPQYHLVPFRIFSVTEKKKAGKTVIGNSISTVPQITIGDEARSRASQLMQLKKKMELNPQKLLPHGRLTVWYISTTRIKALLIIRIVPFWI